MALIHLLHAALRARVPVHPKKGWLSGRFSMLDRFLLGNLNFAPKAYGLGDGFEFQGKSMAVPNAWFASVKISGLFQMAGRSRFSCDTGELLQRLSCWMIDQWSDFILVCTGKTT